MYNIFSLNTNLLSRDDGSVVQRSGDGGGTVSVQAADGPQLQRVQGVQQSAACARAAAAAQRRTARQRAHRAQVHKEN